MGRTCRNEAENCDAQKVPVFAIPGKRLRPPSYINKTLFVVYIMNHCSNVVIYWGAKICIYILSNVINVFLKLN